MGTTRRIFLCISFLGIVWSCENHRSDDSVDSELAIGLAEIPAAGKEGWMGKPSNKIRFSYDFWMSKTEVSQGLFHEFMDGNPKAVDEPDTPIVNVNYWEAVVFCNRLSTRHGFDSVYTYKAIERSLNGGISAISGFNIDYSRNGFRLPTEAEWEFVAHGNVPQYFPWGSDSASAQKYAWFSENSNGTLHPVGEMRPTMFGLFDLAGNAKELVDGWLGEYDSTASLNPVGAVDPDKNGSRIVKGGSFLEPLGSLNSTFRRDIYTVSSGSRSSAIGFRIARGAILKPSWFGGQGFQGKRTEAMAANKGKDILQFLGSSKARLAVVDTKTESLVWFDFSEMDIQPHEIRDSLPIRHPAISPDGEWVAYCTRMEGQAGASQMVIRRLDRDGNDRIVPAISSAAIPRWWVDPHSLDTFLVYVSSSRSNSDSAAWAGEHTFRWKFAAGKMVGTPQEISQSAGAFHGGIDASGTTLATGSTGLFVRNLEEQETSQLFLSPKNGKKDDGSTQVCNVSLSPDTLGKLLFLDFGYPESSTVVGRPYGIHEVLFVSDLSGTILQKMEVPAPFLGWDHCEWSNQAAYAVSSVWDNHESRSAVAAIRMKDSSVLTLLQNGEFLHPALWIGAPSEFQFEMDSLLRYNTTVQNVYVNSHALKMKLFWSTLDSADGYILGSSRHAMGIDPALLSFGTVFNLSMILHSTMDAIRFLDRYILPNAQKLKFLIIGVDVDLLAEIYPGNYSHRIETTIGYQYDYNHHFWVNADKGAFQNDVRSIVVPSPKSVCYENEENGFDDCPVGGSWAITSGCMEEMPDYPESIDSTLVRSALDSLDWMLGRLEEKGIKAFLVQMPLSSEYKKLGRWGTFWPYNWETGLQLNSILSTIVSKHQNAWLFDFYQNGTHSFSDSLAHDCSHLNRSGATVLTQLLNDSIQRSISSVPVE